MTSASHPDRPITTNGKVIVLAAGGTGGHFFPAQALAHSLKKRGYGLILMTDARNTHRKAQSEGNIFADVPQFVLPGGGIAGKGLGGKLKGGLALLLGALQARRLIRHYRPHALIGFGGYPSIPPLFGARLIPKRHRPILILHEGNAILGKANHFMAPFATAIATSYEHVARLPAQSRPYLTGMPVRPDIEALSDIPYTPIEATQNSPVNLLIWGGSLGASIFADIVPRSLAALPEGLRKRLSVVQQVHAKDQNAVQTCYDHAGIKADLRDFIHDVPAMLAKAHLVIGRSGGSSIAELTMSGRPSLLVPLPIAASDEQGHNASALEQKGAAWMYRQPDFTPQNVTSLLEELLSHPEKLAKAAKAAHGLRHPHAAEKLADLVDSVTGTH